MAYPKKLPDDKTLASLVRKGLTNKAIGDLYGVSGESVRQRLVKAGIIRPERISHATYLPWTVRSDHTRLLLARRLRDYSRRQQNQPEDQPRALDAWLKFMDGGNRWGLPMAVHYDRADPDGFWLEPAKDGDRNYIHAPEGA